MDGSRTSYAGAERSAAGRAARGGALRDGEVLSLMRRALAGESLTLDRDDHSLHDLTQVALALMPGAALSIRHAAFMTPLERASIASVGRGRVVFL